MTGRLQVRLLGPFDVTVDGAAVGPGGSLRRAVLALLALRAGEVVTLDALVDGLWGEQPPQSATGVLQTYVSTWRKALQPAGPGRLETVGTGYRLRLDDAESDLLRFTRLATEGRRAADAGRHDQARPALHAALALWGGRPLSGLEERPFHADAVGPLTDLHDSLVEAWSEATLRTGAGGDLPEVVTTLERLLGSQPWRERTAELLMWALFCAGRQHDALAVHERTRRRLGEELGVDPGPALREMHARVLRQDSALCLAPARRAPSRRPPRLDSFVGRERELAEVARLLDGSRLVTLTGPGGSGKTRLAEEAAADAAAGSIDTAVVELAGVEEVALVPGAIAARLGLGAVESMTALAAHLSDRSVLLVLDNLEQIPEAGPAVAELVRGTTDLRLLTTSREPLRVPGERVFPVDPLALPTSDERDPLRLVETPSVALLLDRVRSRGRQGPLQDADAGALRDVVRALDGLPLALEIVAPWFGVLGAAGVLAELGRALDLEDRRPGAGERHRTLRSAIAWSHDRLTPPQQRLLRRMSVLRGGGDLEAIRAVGDGDLGAPVSDVLVDLVERNLVQPAEPVAGVPRFRLLETVRQFAAERLEDAGERAATELRAAEHFAAWAVGLAARSEAPDADPWLARALADADNLRAAMDALARAGKYGEHLQLTVDTWALWFEHGFELEGERRLEAALDAAPRDHPARAIGLVYLASIGILRDREGARQRVEEAVGLARARGDEPVLALALLAMGDFVDDEESARAVAEEAAAIAERLRGRPVRYSPTSADALAGEAADNMSAYYTYRDVAEAIRWERRALDWAERGGNRRLVARHLGLLAWMEWLRGDAESGEEWAARARSLLDGGVDARWEDVVALSSAMVQGLRGDRRGAAAAVSELVSTGFRTGRLLLGYYATWYLVDLLVADGSLRDADAALTRVEELLGGSDDPRFVGPTRAHRARLLRLAGRPEDARPLLEQVGWTLSPDALTPQHLVWLVEQALLTDDADEARRWVDRLEELSRRTGIAIPPWERQLLGALGERG